MCGVYVRPGPEVVGLVTWLVRQMGAIGLMCTGWHGWLRAGCQGVMRSWAGGRFACLGMYVCARA